MDSRCRVRWGWSRAGSVGEGNKRAGSEQFFICRQPSYRLGGGERAGRGGRTKRGGGREES